MMFLKLKNAEWNHRINLAWSAKTFSLNSANTCLRHQIFHEQYMPDFPQYIRLPVITSS